MWNVQRFQVMRLPPIWFPHESDQFRCWKPARMYETLHGFIRSIPGYLSWCRSLMDFVHHNNQTIDVFLAKKCSLSSADFSLRTLFFPSFSKKHLDHRTKKTIKTAANRACCHFISWFSKSNLSLRWPFHCCWGSDYYPRCPHVVIAEAL